MAFIEISDLNLTGMDLFQDRETYLDEVKDSDLAIVKGAATPTTVPFVASLISGAAASVKITQAFK